MKVKSDHRSRFSNLSNWEEEAWKNQGLKGIRTRVTSAIPVRCSSYWAMKPHIGSEVNLLCSYLPVQWSDVKYRSVADPDFELRRRPVSTLLAQPAFLPSIISSFLTQNKGETRDPGTPGPSPTYATIYETRRSKIESWAVATSVDHLECTAVSFQFYRPVI